MSESSYVKSSQREGQGGISIVPGLTRLTVLQHEHLTVSALQVYISKVRQPPHIS